VSTTTHDHTQAQPHAHERSHEHGHTHEHGHSHGHGHQHGQAGEGAAPVTSAERQPSGLGYGAPVLDIGGDIGALVLYTSADLEGVEIEVSLTTDVDSPRTHTQVHRRTVGGSTFWAGVYAELPEGDYQVFWDDPSVRRSFAITGGAVTELDWRQPAS
jgi:hypothetical protein